MGPPATDMEIRSLEHTDFETLFKGFQNAFSDYEIHFEKEEVRSMLKRRGYNPRLSFAAFDNGGIVSFTMNGTGTFNGIPTAYDTGTGTAKEYRGQGLAAKIFTYSIPYLKEAGIRQYVLEVLQNNHRAISVYRKMNFEITREFDCFRQTTERIGVPGGNSSCIIMPVGTDSIRQRQEWCGFNPSWQNSMHSIERGATDMTCLGAFMSGEMVGFCVFDAHTGDLTQIAVAGEHRRRGIASRLLHEAVAGMKTGFIKVLNIDADYRAMHSFLASHNILPASRQFEMTLQLQSLPGMTDFQASGT